MHARPPRPRLCDARAPSPRASAPRTSPKRPDRPTVPPLPRSRGLPPHWSRIASTAASAAGGWEPPVLEGSSSGRARSLRFARARRLRRIPPWWRPLRCRQAERQLSQRSRARTLCGRSAGDDAHIASSWAGGAAMATDTPMQWFAWAPAQRRACERRVVVMLGRAGDGADGGSHSKSYRSCGRGASTR